MAKEIYGVNTWYEEFDAVLEKDKYKVETVSPNIVDEETYYYQIIPYEGLGQYDKCLIKINSDEALRIYNISIVYVYTHNGCLIFKLDKLPDIDIPLRIIRLY